MSTLLAFAADPHVDAYGAWTDPFTGMNLRMLDHLVALEDVGRAASSEGAHGLVVAGDFTERRHVPSWVAGKIAGALAWAPDARVYLRGNHDGQVAGESIVTVLARAGGPGAVAAIEPKVYQVGDVAVCAMPYLDRHWLRAQQEEAVPEGQVVRAISAAGLEVARGLFAEAHPRAAVLVLHQTIAGGRMSEWQQAQLGDAQVVLDAGALSTIGYQGIVAGHLHRHQVVPGAAGGCPIIYAGSTERVDWGEEYDAKGWVLAEVGLGAFHWRFVQLEPRPMMTIDVGAEPGDTDAGAYHSVDPGTLVRLRVHDPSLDVAAMRLYLEHVRGALVDQVIRVTPDAPAAEPGDQYAELSPEAALAAYFAGDPDERELVALGRQVLAAAREDA